MSASVENLAAAVTAVVEPESGKAFADLATLVSTRVDGPTAHITLALRPAQAGFKARLSAAVTEAVAALDGIDNVELAHELKVPGRPIGDDDPVPGVKHVILVMSGKGGVGKSTVATNLALALSHLGAKVGLLDADIYGPSIPTMLGVHGQPMSDGKRIQPLSRFGVKLMSIGFLLEDPKAAVVWRGPMLHGALMQFLGDVAWGDLDFLLLDLPPGTGDVALTLSQKVQSSGAVIVTTPQEVALQDVYKSVSMNRKVGIPVLGVVENQSWFECDHGTRYELFGSGGGQKVAEHAEAPLLGQIPIVPSVREWGDAGTPVVQASPASEVAQRFMGVAGRLVEEVIAGTNKSGDGGGGLTIDRSGGVNRHLPITR